MVPAKPASRVTLSFLCVTAVCSLWSAGAPAETPLVRLEEAARGLTMPVVFAVPPDGTGRRFVAEQIGRIRIIGPDGAPLEEPFLDLRQEVGELYPNFDERGLLGFAFHPDFNENGLFYVSYNGPRQEGDDRDLSLWKRVIVGLKELRGNDKAALEYSESTVYVVERRVAEDDPNRADPDYARLILPIEQPQFNHNGGWLGFGADGYLYLSFGDGGNADDVGEGHAPEGNAQAPGRLLGKILRIDVDRREADRGYAIPPDNPFVGRDGWRPEIFALGFRNAWRCGFDSGDGHALYCGDVGQNAFEEVSLVEKGGNYGWRRKEGRHCFDARTSRTTRTAVPTRI